MAGNAPGIVFSVLGLASIIQGLQAVGPFHHEALEVVVGQNITLPCLQKRNDGLRLVNIEWKRGETKLVVYSPSYGQQLFDPNVTLQIMNSEEDELMGSYLHFTEVHNKDNGMYICEITSFPLGSTKMETNLTVKDDVMLTCNVDASVEIPFGENATFLCEVFSPAEYKWTKDKKLMSESKYLELWQVTDAHAGFYKLTVKIGDKSLHKDLTITVLTATTSLRTDGTNSTHSSPTESFTTGLSTPVNWTTLPNTSSVTARAVEHITPSTISVPISATSSPATHSSTHRLLYNSTTSSDPITAVFKSTQEMTRDGISNESTHYTLQPGDIFSTSTKYSTSGSMSENSEHPDTVQTETSRNTATVKTLNEDKGSGDQTKRSHLLLVLIFIPLLLLIVMIGFICWRKTIKKKMDRPPPFKPPPLPVKYTTTRQRETRRQSFPISRCNSVAEAKDFKQTIV